MYQQYACPWCAAALVEVTSPLFLPLLISKSTALVNLSIAISATKMDFATELERASSSERTKAFSLILALSFTPLSLSLSFSSLCEFQNKCHSSTREFARDPARGSINLASIIFNDDRPCFDRMREISGSIDRRCRLPFTIILPAIPFSFSLSLRHFAGFQLQA